MEIVAFFKKALEDFLKKRKVGKIFGNAEQCKKSGKLTQSLNYYKECVQLCEKNDCNGYYKAKSLFEIGDIYYYTKNNNDEAPNYFTKVIEEFKYRFSDKKIRVCVAKAYNRRGIVEYAIAKKDSSWRIDLRKSKENYDQVIDTFFEYDDPDVVLEVARARLNRGTINLQSCNNSDYNELIEIERKYNKRAYHDELRKLVALQFYNKAFSYYQKRKIDEALTACKQALEKCKEVKKKDTENIDIDVQNVFCFHFWEGKPISCREIKVNVLMLQGLAYVQEIWNKLPDDYTDEKERGVDEYEEQVVKVIKEFGSQELVNQECNAILTIIRDFSQGNTRQLTNKRLMICESAIKIWEWLEKESLLERKTANYLKEQLYLYVCGTLNSVDKNYKDKNKLITICDNWVEKIPHENKCHVGILALSVPIYDQLGYDDEVMRKCEVLDDYLRNLTFDRNNINDQFIISVVIEAFYSRWCVCKREAVIESKGWEDVVKAGEAIVKAGENFNCSFDFLVEIDDINKIIRNDSNKDSVIREKVFDYYYKIAIN